MFLKMSSCVIKALWAAGSLMRRHPRYIWLLRQLRLLGKPVYDMSTMLGNFGAPTAKPLLLSSISKSLLVELWESRPYRFFERLDANFSCRLSSQ